MSDSPQIYTLIPKVMKDIGAVSKDRRNEQQRYAFRGIEDFYQAAHPAMIAHGVFPAPVVLERTEYRFEKTNDQGRVTSWLHVVLKVEHKFYAPDGSYITVTTYGEGLDNSDKATNKAMSGAMKYALIELFCVPTQDVEDADRTSPETGTRRPNIARIEEDIPIKPKNGATALAKAVLKTAEDVRRILPEGHAGDLISTEQAQALHKRFQESLKEPLRSKAEALLHEWLGVKLYLDSYGNPSASAITQAEYASVGKQAVEFAKGL